MTEVTWEAYSKSALISEISGSISDFALNLVLAGLAGLGKSGGVYESTYWFGSVGMGEHGHGAGIYRYSWC